MLRLLIALLVSAGALSPAWSGTRDPKAVETAERAMAAMGGKDAFGAQRYLTFRFTVEREGKASGGWLHVWDRNTGRYALEGVNRDGNPLRVVFNINTREGDAWVGEAKADPEDIASLLEYAYGRYINDTYWLLMPWKWLDPGVTLAYEGQAEAGGDLCDVVRLTFDDGTGLTSKDAYWGYVSVDTGLMVQWQFLLQDNDGNPGTGDRSTYRWEEWEEVGGGVHLSRRKTRTDGGNAAIMFPIVRLSTEIDEDAFRPGPAAAAKESR